MTHDELLELVDKYMAFSEGFGPTACLALRAVVELHKPVQSYLFDEEACSHCSSEEDRLEILYPCPTIKAITEQLK